MHNNGIFDGVWSTPTQGGGSFDWLQIISLFKCINTQSLKDNSLGLDLVMFQ
jgi:hypothetical protein